MGAAAPFGWCEMRTSKRRITYVPHPGATAETEVDTLSRVYALLVRKHQERKQAAPACRPDETKEGGSENGSRLRSRIHS